MATIGIIIALAVLVFIAFVIGQMYGGYIIKKKFLNDEDERRKLQTYMNVMWVSSPSRANFIYYLIILVLMLVSTGGLIRMYGDEVLKDYDKGDIVKVETETITKKPGQEDIRNSTFRYERK